MPEAPGITLNEVNARFTHMNTRTEKHGTEEKLAVDMDFAWDTTNDTLAQFNPTLKWSLYAKPEKGPNELFEDDGHLTVYRYPFIKQIHWKGGELVGATVTLHRGVGGKQSDLTYDADVKNWKIEPREGGTVVIWFRVTARPEKKQRGELLDLLEMGSVTISVEPPEPITGEEPKE